MWARENQMKSQASQTSPDITLSTTYSMRAEKTAWPHLCYAICVCVVSIIRGSFVQHIKKDKNAKVKALYELWTLNNEFECGAIMSNTQ